MGGYGDFYPVTQFGYVIGSVTILYGTVVFALPVGVIGSTFSRQFERFQQEQEARHAMSDQTQEEHHHPTVSISWPPVVISEFNTTLEQVAKLAEVPPDMVTCWVERLMVTVRFDH